MEPLLAASSLRVDVGGKPELDGLSLEARGKWVLILGAPRALFLAASGAVRPVRGHVAVGGERAAVAAARATAAGASLDPPLPASWTVGEYARWSARLAGHRRNPSRRAATDALAGLGLLEFERVRLGAASLAVRRATVIAAAIATEAAVVLLEDPVAGLPEDVARPLASLTVRALSERRVVLFAGRIALDAPFASAADVALVVEGSAIAAQGSPAVLAARRNSYSVRVVGKVEALLRKVGDLGATLEGAQSDGMAARFTVDLGPLRTFDLLRAAEECECVVLDLRPVGHVFA